MTELNTVLDKLAPLLSRQESGNVNKITDPVKIFDLLNELEPLLRNRNTGCMNYLDDLRGVPEADDLISQIEDFKFKQALKSLKIIKEKNGVP